VAAVTATTTFAPTSVDSLVDRVEAVRRFVAVSSPYLPDDLIAPARTVTTRAGQRLGLSREHTIVALAGATGSGKSSLFNALTGTQLSTVGVRRPTTGTAHASVWGSDDAGPLLDWLGVGRRYSQDAGDPGLRGLVLLDLPDFDSVELAHRAEVDRLLELVDLVVWVLDPQKYADKLLHRQYLSQFHRHRDITVVVLNQADLLTPSDVERCLADLRVLLASDGLGGVPSFATSATAAPGIEPLTATLRQAVAARLAMLQRLSGDVDTVVTGLMPLVGPEAGGPDPSRQVAARLTTALANAAGVPTVVRATEQAYRHRALRATGWPLTRWIRRTRPDPLGRLHLAGTVSAARGASPSVPETLVAPTSLPPARPADRAGVELAVRDVAEHAGAGRPEPWSAAMLAAARAHEDDLADALDAALARTDLGVSHRPLWWRAVGVLQWCATVVARGAVARTPVGLVRDRVA
jgi:GTP-binding protein EngB required for normal cell division